MTFAPHSRPLIGLPGRRKTGADIRGIAEVMRDIPIDVYLADYARGILEAGGLPIHLPCDVDPADLAEELDGVVLTGGADVDPSLYGAEPETELFPPEPERDRFELTLIDAAIDRHIPVLGVCRGLQLLNVHGGGSLHQHDPAHSRFDLPVTTLVDDVTTVPGTTAAELYGPALRVNSLHHQTIDRLADGWIVSARAGDGTVEAIEQTSHDVFAVQWHPEMLPSRSTDPAFRWIVDRARSSRTARGSR